MCLHRMLQKPGAGLYFCLGMSEKARTQTHLEGCVGPSRKKGISRPVTAGTDKIMTR